MAEIKWIKIATDIFDDEKVMLIESMPNAYTTITVWFKLLCLAGKSNNNGVFLMNDRIAYTDKMLATIFRMDEMDVKLALDIFEQFGMIEIVNGAITIPNWEKHQSLDKYEQKKERDRIYQADRRAKQKLIVENSTNNRRLIDDKSSDTSSDVEKNRLLEEEKEKEIEIDIEKEKDKKKAPSAGSVYFPNNEELEKTFKDFVAMRKSMKNGAMTERAITMMINKLSGYDEQTAIAMLEQSILNNWKDVYELKQQKPQPKKKEPDIMKHQYSDDYFKNLMRAEYRRLKEEIKGGGQ